MVANQISLQNAGVAENSAVKKFVNFLMLFFPLTSFLIIPTIQSTTIITLLAGLLTMALLLMPTTAAKSKFVFELLNFLCLVALLCIISQLINLLVSLKLPPDIILVNLKDFTKTFFRPSLLTQTLELTVGYTIYLQVKYFSDESVIKYIYWGLRLLCFYGLYEFCYYLIFRQNGDFVVNRTFGDERSGSLFQTINIGGISLMRIKGYTGEPSMFVYTVFPFWVLSVALKRKFDTVLLLICLILTFSTTAYCSVIVFAAGWLIYKRHAKIIFYGLILVAVLCFVIQLDAFQHLFDSIYNLVFADKVTGGVQSSKDRMGHLFVHINFWSGLTFLNQIFGVGFGYVRSTDFFSTILVNCGALGFLIFTIFFYRKTLLPFANKDVAFAYRFALFLLYLILMLTVPEFSYPSLWIFCALPYVLTRTFNSARPDALHQVDGKEDALLLQQAS